MSVKSLFQQCQSSVANQLFYDKLRNLFATVRAKSNTIHQELLNSQVVSAVYFKSTKLYRFYITKKLFLLLVLGLVLAACEDISDSDLGFSSDTNVSVNYVDTTTIKVSTVLLDSVATNGTGTILAGQYFDDLLGIIQADAYFQLAPGGNASWSPNEDAVLDSVKLIMPYLGLSYGDTLEPLTLNVYRLTQAIEPRQLLPYVGTEESFSYFYNTTALYNTSKTASESQPLGSFTFKPRPSRNDSIGISLPKSLGQEWLELTKAGDSRLISASDFQSYFKGLKVAVVNTGSIVGFDAAKTKVRVYYRQATGNATQNLTYDFPLVIGSTQYNRLVSDYKQTVLAGISRGGEHLASNLTGNMGFTQSGTGLMVKLEFPYLIRLKEILNPLLINRVVLEIEPVTGTNLGIYTPPTTLALYETDQNNVPTGPVYMSDAATEQTANYIPDAEYNQKSYYRFDLTQHFMNRFQESQAQNNALLLGVPRSAFIQTLNRLSVGGANHQNRIKLKIYHTIIK